MELNHFINRIIIFALNVLFFCSGICLNSLVILTYWRTAQLRKKLCYFMIMVLSCCDLLVVLTIHPLKAVDAMFWLTGKKNGFPSWLKICNHFAFYSVGFSFFALLVMNFDRYLATYYPLFHRTSVTKRRLLTLLGILSIIEVVLGQMASRQLHNVIGFVIIAPPMFLINYKLFRIARKNRRNNGTSPKLKKSLSLKNVSSCLLTTACFLMLSIPGIVSVGLEKASKKTPTLSDHAKIAGLWTATIAAINSTCNCLIFFWKNTILRIEGMKLVKRMKICQRFRSQSDR